MIKEKQLEMLGLSDKEARLYLSALISKPFTVADIAKKSGIKRPTCYIILDELVKRGLISVIPKAKKRSYKAEPPENFIRQAKRMLSYAEKFVPSLRHLFEEGKEISIVKYYYGQNGIKNIYENILDSGVKEIRYIGSSGPMVEAVGDDFLRDYVERCIKMGIKRITIRMRGTEVNDPIYHGTKNLLREIRYAPKDIYIPSTVFIYDNKIAIISTAKASFGIMIESQEFYETIMGLFKALWSISSEK
jgi:HTH-type transcriptional regulator, sugar sensing transcriptional regulator